MRTKILKELQESYKPYASFWEEWKEYKFNGLTTTDIYMIEVQIENNFTIQINDFVMFYNQLESLRSLTIKLKTNYVEFKEWLVMKFQFAVMKFADGIPLDLFFRIPLIVFYKMLPDYKTLSPDLIKILEKFNCQTLHEIFLLHSDKDFRNNRNFPIVVEFQMLLNIEKNSYQSLGKEVIQLDRNYALN